MRFRGEPCEGETPSRQPARTPALHWLSRSRWWHAGATWVFREAGSRRL